MDTAAGEQIPPVRVGVDVGGTFTDLVAWNQATGELKVVKVSSTPPEFHRAVIEALGRVDCSRGPSLQIVHGSTVATNALLQRAGAPVAFITTEGFRDMLLIGRQNRPLLTALRVERPPPATAEENWYTLEERLDARGEVVHPLDPQQVDALLTRIESRGVRDLAVCLLFAFVNSSHEQLIGERARARGMRVSLSSEILLEFREYERASTTAVNASLRPVVEAYLDALARELHQKGLASSRQQDLRIMHSGGGTLAPDEASKHAARLVLSGPAGGVLGAAHVARIAGFCDVITYDMGGTSTDVAAVLDAAPRWTTGTRIDGLPIALPMFDVHTVGAGGGSVAMLDAGGALRVGPQSAGAMPGPACYGRGGTRPTVTDANLVLGRIQPDRFLGGEMKLDANLARAAIEPLARAMGKSIEAAAMGIVRVADANMVHAIRAVTSRRGHDPRRFALVSFGGAGGLHACSLAEQLDIARVIVPPYCGVLSALGMVVAPAVADASKTVLHLGEQLDDDRLAAEFGGLSGQTMDVVPYEQTASVEVFADARFAGQSHELKVQIERPIRATIETRFREAYLEQYGSAPADRAIEIVTLRVRRIGRASELRLPPLAQHDHEPLKHRLINESGATCEAIVVTRGQIIDRELRGPLLLVDAEATTYIPRGWRIRGRADGVAIAEPVAEDAR